MPQQSRPKAKATTITSSFIDLLTFYIWVLFGLAQIFAAYVIYLYNKNKNTTTILAEFSIGNSQNDSSCVSVDRLLNHQRRSLETPLTLLLTTLFLTHTHTQTHRMNENCENVQIKNARVWLKSASFSHSLFTDFFRHILKWVSQRFWPKQKRK